MSQSNYDAIIIGGGHNGLAAASVLAKNGRKVLVLESRKHLGGLAAREEFHPGFFSTGVWQETRTFSPTVAEGLDLERHGLEFEPQDLGVLGIDNRTGESLLLRKNADASASAIAKFSESDARKYFEYREFQEKVGSFLRLVAESPAPEVLISGTGLWEAGKLALGLKMLGNRDMQDLLRTAPMCTADGLGEWFENDFLKALLAGPAVFGTWTGPWSPGSHLFQLLGEATFGKRVVGGPAAVTRALEKRARNLGVEIRTEEAVTSLKIEGGQLQGVTTSRGETLATKQIGASCDPKTLFLNLIPSQALPYELEHEMKVYRMRGTTAKLRFAVEGTPTLKDGSEIATTQLAVHGGIDDLERSFDPVKYGEMTDCPSLELSIPSLADSSLAPEGNHVVEVLYHYAPHDLRAGWTDESKKLLQSRTEASLKQHLDGFEIKASQVLSPKDIEAEYGVTGGQIHHGENALDQFMTRPSGGTARHSTPIDGVFLCGGGSHPGGGLTGRPGLLGAQAMMK